jgi:hypothetical protein
MKQAYQITSLSVRLCVPPPLITFEPLGIFAWNLGGNAIQGNLDVIILKLLSFKVVWSAFLNSDDNSCI